ncbi:MAG: extracellular solute-binding protein [Paenibacillaceae bacterium]|nr:extracellular solute-binding protein [Paenibacillaceae bacterium]
MKPKRTTSRNRLEEMIRTLRGDIAAGRYAEGDFLPSELELCERHSLSKNTVRKGLDVLVQEGSIEKVPRIGAKVVGSRQTLPRSAVTLRFGYYTSLVQETDILRLVDRFNETHDEIRVQPIPVSFPRSEQLVEQYLREDIFDVLTVNLYDYEFMKGLLEPFEPFEEAYDFLNEPFIAGDKQHVLPFVFTPVILCYNKDHFRERNVPEPHSGWTWDDLCEAGRKLAAGKERLGFYFHLMSENRWPIFLLQNDVRFERNADGKLELNDLKMKSAAEACMRIAGDQFPSYLSQNDSDAMSLFLNQKTSIVMATYSFLNALRAAEFEYDLAPLPHLEHSRTMLVIIGLAVNKRSGQKAAAKTFVDFLMSYDTQLYVRQQTLSLPGVKRAAEWTGPEAVKRPYRFHMYREIAHTFRRYSDLRLTANELRALGDELRYYWSQLESLDSILERIERKL